MAKILKATVGISFSERMFRVSTQAGALTDDLLALRGKQLELDSFDAVGRDSTGSSLRLHNKESGMYLVINLDSITFTYDLYDKDTDFKFDTFLAWFKAIWETFDARIKAPPIRRIGFVTEQRFYAGSDSNKILVDRLTTIKPVGFPAKFHLTFEDRKDVGHGGLLDPTKDDFINIIRSFYDGSMDIDHPEDESIRTYP